jgi:hypothetical protein
VRGTGCAVSLRDLRVSAQSHFLYVAQGGRIVGLRRVCEGGKVGRVESTQSPQSFVQLCSQDVAVEGSRCCVVWCYVIAWYLVVSCIVVEKACCFALR